jgi:4-hydroxy-3-polyprenylbenzoate decarboxylase
MAFKDLRGFLARLDALGELQRVDAEVDPILEIARITELQSKLPGGGKALLFNRVKGSSFPVATNLFGSYARMSAALEVAELSALTARMERLLLFPGEALAPRLVALAPCQQVVQHAPDLGSYPFLKSWPRDGGRFITLPLVFTRDPESGLGNCGMYRVRLFEEDRAGIRWKRGSGGSDHYQKYQAAGRGMPVAIAVGADPSLTLAACLPLPEALDEISFAGFLRGEPVEMARCLSCDLLVPAHAEIVIEGYLEGETRPEGRFGNHTGRYDQGEEVPVLRVTCITHRLDPICQATVVGPPPMEDCYLAKAAERLLLPLSRRQCPEIVDITQPLEGIFHGCALVSIRKSVPGQGRQVLESLRGSGWLKRGKLIVVVDAGAEPLSLAGAFWQALNEARLPRDLALEEGFLGIDATAKFPEEGGAEEFEQLRQEASVSALVERRWREYGFL